MEKVACWRTKAAISLKRVKIEERKSYYGRPIEIHQRSFERYHASPTPYGLPFLEIGGLQLSYPLLSQEQVKLRNSNLASTFTGPIRITKLTAHKKILEKRERGLIQGLPKYFGYPRSQKRVMLRTSNLANTFTGPIRIKPVKIWRKGSVGVSRGCPNFWVPPIISGTGKATDFKFCRNIHRVDRNKSS